MMYATRSVSRVVGLSLVLCVACAVWSVSAASFYVDSAASGANNGSSWINAWTSAASINWTSVQPGDTIYISGGVTTKTYASLLTVGKNGTVGARITISKGLDAGHNGTPIFNGIHTELSNRQYITFYGIAWHNLFNTSTATFANAVMAPQSLGIKMDSCSWSNVNNCMNFSEAQSFWVTNCTAVATRGDAVIRAGGAYPYAYDANIIENCDFEVIVNSIDGGGPDGIQTGHGITARNNIFRVRRITGYYTSNQHNDMFQAPGTYLKIYNNEFINVGDCSIMLSAWWADSVHSNIQIYNNIFRIVEAIDPYPEYIRMYNNVGNIARFENITIANNLFVDNGTRNNIAWYSYGPSGIANPQAINCRIVNNIFYNSGSAFAWILQNSSAFTPTSWTIANNVYYPAGNSYVSYLCSAPNLTAFNAAKYNMDGSGGWPNWLTFGKETSGSAGNVIFTAYTPGNAANDYHLSESDATARGTGRDESSWFSIDKDNLTRVVPWDRGPYLFPGAGTSTLNISSATYTVSEGVPTVTISFGRSGSINGVVGCSYATANGTATAGVNYTTTSGSLSWPNGNADTLTVNVPIIDANMLDTKTFTLTISTPTGGAQIGAQATTTVSITGTGVAPTPVLDGHVWPVTNANVVIQAPFVVVGDYVWQSISTDNPADGGSMAFTFTNNAGNYKFTFEVDAESGAANSCFFNTNAQPTSPFNVFDVVSLTTGFEDRDGTWRGETGTFDTPAPIYSPVTNMLAGGTNTLIVRGREPMKFKTVSLVQISPPAPTDPATVVSVSTTYPEGEYKTNIVIPINIAFNTNVVVTGTPELALDSGGTATYTSGSGTSVLLFTYVVGPGENDQHLDYAANNSLTLNGGTIKNDVIDADLTLPEPGAAGSISSSAILIIDTLKPTVSVSAPAVSAGNVSYQVTYSDLNFQGFNLASTNTTLVTTGTVTGTLSITGGGVGNATLLVSGVSGNGTIQVNIAAGSASDLAGNLANAASSPVATVETTLTTVIRDAKIRNAIIRATP